MVNSVECSTYIEQGQKGDFRSIDSPKNIREEANKESFRGVSLTESRLINWQEIKDLFKICRQQIHAQVDNTLFLLILLAVRFVYPRKKFTNNIDNVGVMRN